MSTIARVSILFLAALLAFAACTTPSDRTSTALSSDPDEPWSAPPLELSVSIRDGKSGEAIPLAQLFDRLAQADVVFLGESHTDETTHRLELATYEALLARRANNVVLALEFFERDVQPALDAYLSGASDERTFLAAARPWPNYATAYRPLIERAKAVKSPVIASNFPAPLRRTLAKDNAEDLSHLSADDRRNAPAELLPETPAYWRRVDNATRGHLGMLGNISPGDPRLMDTQSLWDNAMGESCARALDAHPGALVLHMNGGFHSAYWDGTVRQLHLRKPSARVLTLAIEPALHPRSATSGGAPIADYVALVESRAKDVDEGAYAVVTPRELKYRLFVPPNANDGARVPLLVWLGDDGENARESLAEWRERLGDTAAIAVIDPPYRETQDDLVEGGRWYWPDTFDEDVGALTSGIEETWSYLLRHFPIDRSRVCLAGEGTGATIVAASSMLTSTMDVRAVARAPRRFAHIKDLSLPLPELAGDERKPTKSLTVFAPASDTAWWSSEIAAYRGVGFTSELAPSSDDPWKEDLERENAVRQALGLDARAVPKDAPRRFAIAGGGSRARVWARRIAARHLASDGELVAVFANPPSDAQRGHARELSLDVHGDDFASKRALPRCPGAFGGTTVVVLPDEVTPADREAWLGMESLDPLAKTSRFLRLRVATSFGEHTLHAVLAELLAQGRKNVLVVPAVFCTDAAHMRALKSSVKDLDDRMTIAWQPGLGSLGSDPE